MKFLLVLVHAISFIFRSGAKADLTSEDGERSMTSKYQNIGVWRHWLMVNMFMMYKPCICVTIKVSTYSTERWSLFRGV